MARQIFIVPMENNVAAPSDRWVAIHPASQWDEKPRWSPGGGVIYFVSDRDGYFWLWAQRLDTRTRGLIGLPVAVYQLHSARRAMSNLGAGLLEIGVAKTRIVLGLGDLTGDIWSTQRNR